MLSSKTVQRFWCDDQVFQTALNIRWRLCLWWLVLKWNIHANLTVPVGWDMQGMWRILIRHVQILKVSFCRSLEDTVENSAQLWAFAFFSILRQSLQEGKAMGIVHRHIFRDDQAHMRFAVCQLPSGPLHLPSLMLLTRMQIYITVWDGNRWILRQLGRVALQKTTDWHKFVACSQSSGGSHLSLPIHLFLVHSFGV